MKPYSATVFLLIAMGAKAGADSPASRSASAPPAVVAPSTTTPLPCRKQSHHAATGVTIFRDCADAPEMIALRGASYRMGDGVGDGQTYERPSHEVHLGPYALGRFEVTSAEWQTCVAAAACSESHLQYNAQHSRYPIAGVSWTQAKAYVDWLAVRTGKPYRLPSEAEWEYAARAGEEGRYPFSSFELGPCSRANLFDASGAREHADWNWAEPCDDHFAEAAPVGSFPPNAWGFHDLLGNVWEWVGDCWHPDYLGAPADGSTWSAEPCRKHVNRGGGWGNNVRALRFSARDADPTDAHSDGLGFRVARSLSVGELAQIPTVTAESKPSPTTSVPEAPKSSSGKVSQVTPPPSPVMMAVPPPLATSLATERTLDVHITAKGTQAWRNGLQHTDATTAQDYVLSTRLRSDGVLYGDNLLDLDPATREANKERYYGRLGLIRLKAANGGHLPRTAEEIAALEARLQADMPNCIRDEQCASRNIEGLAALDALKRNSIEDLEAEIAAPATGEAARWLYFFGYAGCPIRIHIANEAHIDGVRAYDHAHKNIKPWSLDRSADTNGDEDDRTTLCQRYVATIDVRSGEVYLENLYIPSAPGTTIRNSHGNIERLHDELPVPAELLDWTSAQVRKTRESLTASTALTWHTPLDGDSTVMGLFEGRLDATLAWSFAPVEGAALAKMPAAEIAK